MQAMIIPGNQNTDISECWYLSVKRELEKMGIKVIAKNMPDPDLARRKYWIPFIKEQTHGEEKTILIGHSSGAVAILRYLENHRIEGAVIVGANHTDLGDEKEKISGYYNEPWQWDKIRQNVKWIIQFASTDDPYIPIEEMRYIRDHLKLEHHEYADRGHFNTAEFPELVEAIKKRLEI